MAEHAKRELGLATIVAENNAVAKAALASAAVIVTSEGEMDKAPCPVIAVDHPPVRLARNFLEDIAAHMSKQPGRICSHSGAAMVCICGRSSWCIPAKRWI